MAKAERFEELIVWQKARLLVALTYRVTRVGSLARDFGLRDQMQRAAVSIASNIAEGFERMSPGGFAQFLRYAQGSCSELRTQIVLAHDVGGMATKDFESLHAAAEEVARLLGGLRQYLEAKAKRP